MRLIDADKLETTAVLGVQLQHADSRYYYFYEEETIDKAPTVKAIPIEELFRFIESRVVKPDGVEYTDDLLHLKAFIEDWRMENEEGYRDEVNRWWEEHSSRFD